MREIILPAHNWQPRDYQIPAWRALESGIKRFALPWHRRAGKDEFALHWTAVSAFQRVGTYWHLLPQANQARKAIWAAINPHTGRRRIDEVFPVALRETTKEQEMFIRFKNESTWQVVGSDNFNSLVGSPPIGLVLSEYALANPAAWAFLRPILAENDGWAMFISTARGRNHFSRLYEYARHDKHWFAQLLTVDDTGAIKPEVIARELRELTAERGLKEAKAIIRQEYYCDFDADIPGSYYGESMARAMQEGRIGDYPWLPSLPVGAACDIGYGDQTVIWFFQQLPSGRIRIIDVLVGSGVGVDWYAQRVIKRPYMLADTIWPHDGDHGNIRDVSGSNLIKQAEGYGWRPIRCIDRDHTVDHGIQATRQIMGQIEWNETPVPFDGESPAEARERMQRALDAVRQYRREWDEKRQCFKDAPLHDWTSDYADALRYLARGRKPFGQRSYGNRPQIARVDYEMF